MGFFCYAVIVICLLGVGMQLTSISPEQARNEFMLAPGMTFLIGGYKHKVTTARPNGKYTFITTIRLMRRLKT